MRPLSFLLSFIGLFNIVVAIVQLVGHPGLGTASIGAFGLAMLTAGVALCPREKRYLA